jgi:UDP-N-acetylglucosamine 2-epimerase (non-hydrolysing)
VRPPADYQVPDVAAKVARLVISYTGYVNRTVWQRNHNSCAVL